MLRVKIQLMSDLHLEGHPAFQPRPAPGAELLVLAGDIGSYQRGSQLQQPDFGLARFSPQRGWPVPTYIAKHSRLATSSRNTRARKNGIRRAATRPAPARSSRGSARSRTGIR